MPRIDPHLGEFGLGAIDEHDDLVEAGDIECLALGWVAADHGEKGIGFELESRSPEIKGEGR
jgi:hypothetical protein